MAGGRPRLIVRKSPYFAAACFALAIEARNRIRPFVLSSEPKGEGIQFSGARPPAMSRRAALRLAAIASLGQPIAPDRQTVARVGPDGRGGLYSREEAFTHSSGGRIDQVEAVVEAMRRLLKAAARDPSDLALLDDVQFDLAAVLLDRDAEAAWRRIREALGDDAHSFRLQIENLRRSFEAA